jgi:hypothetical protein
MHTTTVVIEATTPKPPKQEQTNHGNTNPKHEPAAVNIPAVPAPP